MKAFWQYFLAHGDKLLAAATGIVSTLQMAGVIQPSWAVPVLATFTFIHNTFLPESTTNPSILPSSNTSNVGKVLLVGALLSMLGIGGCTLLGITKPLTFDESLASAYVAHTAVLSAANTALSAGSITSAQASKVNTLAITARSMLDETKQLENAGNASGASAELTLATAALTAVQTFLNTSKAATPAASGAK